MKNCCICGTVRNCSQYLNNVFSNIEKIGSLFDDYVILLYYDSSDDNTLDLLQSYKLKNNKLIFHINTEPAVFSNYYRTYNIAKGRNWCIQYIRNNFPTWNYFIMMDFDNVCSSNINLHILKKHLSDAVYSSWDALSFNKKPYYDIWALSIFPFVHSSLHFNIGNMDGTKIVSNFINHVISTTPKNNYIKCFSAFNGFAIYKTNKFLNCNYDSKCRFDLIPESALKYYYKLVSFNNNSIHVDCEHRAFHYEAIKLNNAQIRITTDILFP